MKKLFLIPLMTLLCSVMAWADNVAEVNGVGYPTLQAAINAAESGATVTLLTDVAEEVTIAKSLTLAGDKRITKQVAISGSIKLTLAGVKIVVSNNDGIACGGFDIEIALADGTTNEISAPTGGCDGILGGYAGGWTNDTEKVVSITGNGSLTISAAQFSYHGYSLLNVSAPNVTFTKTIKHYGDVIISAGNYSDDPYDYVVEGYLVTYANSLYSVVSGADVVVYNASQYAVYNALAVALSESEAGDRLIMFASDNNAATISQNLTIEYGNYSVNVAAGEGYTKIENDQRIVITNNALAIYLQGDSSDPYTVSTNNDISAVGQIIVKGTKVVIVNEDVTVTCAHQSAGNSIIIPAGAFLTIKGNGNFTSDRGLLEVLEGGTLVVGSTDKSDQLHFVTTDKSIKNRVILNEGTATIYNADIDAASGAIRNVGTMVIDGGSYVGKAAANGTGAAPSGMHCYAINCMGSTTIRNAYVYGYHGGVSPEEGGSLKLENCDLRGRDNDGLYVCTRAIVSAYDTKFFTEKGGSNRSAYIGNNDAFNTFGLIYLYDGCVLKNRMCVQGKGDKEPDMYFPVSISTESKWYQIADNGGGVGPLPEGYVYYSILDNDGTKTGNDTINAIDKEIYSHILYDAGYRWKVVSTATKTAEVDENATTIPWQQSSTWNANKASTDTEEVPTVATVVTIPAGKTVVVSADEDKNNDITDAVAEQIFIGDGAKLTVEAGTTLTVGDGGVNIANGGQMIVKDGAVVRVGKSGLVTTEEEALMIENTQTKAGVFMIDPAVTENTQPKATVKLESKAYHDVTNDIFHWQHFAIPTVGVPDEFKMPVQTAIYDLDENNAWKTLSGMSELGTPFKGYNLTNWATAKGTVYEFYGNIIGNGDGKANFTGRGYNFCGNSYTAPIDIVKMLQDIKDNTTVDVEPTITIYDTENDKYQAVTVASIENASWMGTPVFTQIAPMQGFFLNLRTNEAGEYEVIDYSNSVWGNPSIATGGMLAPARHEANDNKGIRMVVAANGREDDVLMVEKAEYTATFDDGADATKKMSERSFNLYANINNEKQAVVATNNMENMLLGFESVEAGEYTIRFYANNVEGEYYLLDVLTGAKMAIANGAEYTFTQDANVANAVRFEIIGAAKVPTALENVAETATKKGIYTMSGQFVGNDYNALPAGVYVLDGQKIVK